MTAITIAHTKSGPRHTTDIPPRLVHSLSYPVYYPKDKSTGYTYLAGSANIKTEILFYTLKNESSSIYVTEQSAPAATINLSSLPQYSELSVPIGHAAIGTGLGNPSVVIMTPSTLVELTSTKGVSKTEIVKVARALVHQNNE